LALYLLSFIICFELPFLYKRVVWLPLFVLSLALLAYLPNLRMGADALWRWCTRRLHGHGR
jgi:hypothetical protein